MSRVAPYTKLYFSEAEPRQYGHLPQADLSKFDDSTEFERVYDNGNTVTYRYLGR